MECLESRALCSYVYLYNSLWRVALHRCEIGSLTAGAAACVLHARLRGYGCGMQRVQCTQQGLGLGLAFNL